MYGRSCNTLIAFAKEMRLYHCLIQTHVFIIVLFVIGVSVLIRLCVGLHCFCKRLQICIQSGKRKQIVLLKKKIIVFITADSGQDKLFEEKNFL